MRVIERWDASMNQLNGEKSDPVGPILSRRYCAVTAHAPRGAVRALGRMPCSEARACGSSALALRLPYTFVVVALRIAVLGCREWERTR